MEYMTLKEAGEKWGVSPRRVNYYRAAGRAYKGDQEIELTGRKFLLLTCLMENADRIISKERLYERVWGEYSGICDNTIMVHIRLLREKIEDTPSNPQRLITVKGLGYKLKKRIE